MVNMTVNVDYIHDTIAVNMTGTKNQIAEFVSQAI